MYSRLQKSNDRVKKNEVIIDTNLLRKLISEEVQIPSEQKIFLGYAHSHVDRVTTTQIDDVRKYSMLKNEVKYLYAKQIDKTLPSKGDFEGLWGIPGIIRHIKKDNSITRPAIFLMLGDSEKECRCFLYPDKNKEIEVIKMTKL